MRHLRVALLLAGALACGGCFQMTTVVHVNGDGSGTIDHSMLVTKAALAQLRQFSMLAGGRGQTVDLVSEEQARKMAESLGPGVAYVSSEPVVTPLGEGRHATYAFTDISTLRISQQPDAPAGLSVRTQGLSTDGGAITCAFSRETNGNALLRINLPEPNIPGTAGSGAPGDPAIAQQLAMVRSMLAGARIVIGVEPAGTLVSTSSPYVDGSRVTLLDVSLDQLLGDESVLTRLQAAKSADDLKAALKEVPGLKITLDREVTIEFTPAK